MSSLQDYYLALSITIIEHGAWNKSSLLMKIILQKTQMLQLFTIIIKTESSNKNIKNAKMEGLGVET